MENQEKNETTVLPENPEIMVKNPRIGKVRKLEEEVRRQNELEQLRTKRIRKEQEYIEQMSKAVEDHLHGISEDKLQGMTEYRNAWYQGTAFGMFFLSLILTGICGYLHGFGSELCIFMAFYTAIEGTLLTNGKRQHALLDMVTRILYLLLFPAMLIVFVCFELGFTEYGIVVPVLTIAGVVILVLGAVSYFVYDPYRLDRKNHKKADRYIRDIEKAAVKEVELEEKALAKQARKQEKLELKEEARQERAAKRRERKNRRDEKLTGWKESIRKKLPAKKKATEESRTETGIPKEPEAVTEEKPQAGAEESGTPETTGPVENTEPVETVEQKDAPAEPEQGTPEETGKAEEIDTTNGEEK